MAEKPQPPASGTPRDRVYLTPRQLVDRWVGRIKVETLANWRYLGRGPKFVRLGTGKGKKGEVVYELRDVRAFEDENRMVSTQEKATTVPPPPGPVTRGS